MRQSQSNSKGRKVINIETGIIFDSVRLAADSVELPDVEILRNCLDGKRLKNKFPHFKYYIQT